MSNALIDPATSDNNANHATVMCPDQSNHHRIAACTPNNACVSLTKRSFGWRSTTTPAYNVSSSTGSDPAADTTPTMNALFVNCSASQPRATDSIHVPMTDPVCPNQNSRKLRCTISTRIGFRYRGTGATLDGVTDRPRCSIEGGESATETRTTKEVLDIDGGASRGVAAH